MVNGQRLTVNYEFGREKGIVMAIGDDIEDRLIAFAVRIVKHSDALPRTIASTHSQAIIA
jgi:hypothetical protein